MLSPVYSHFTTLESRRLTGLRGGALRAIGGVLPGDPPTEVLVIVTDHRVGVVDVSGRRFRAMPPYSHHRRDLCVADGFIVPGTNRLCLHVRPSPRSPPDAARGPDVRDRRARRGRGAGAPGPRPHARRRRRVPEGGPHRRPVPRRGPRRPRGRHVRAPRRARGAVPRPPPPEQRDAAARVPAPPLRPGRAQRPLPDGRRAAAVRRRRGLRRADGPPRPAARDGRRGDRVRPARLPRGGPRDGRRPRLPAEPRHVRVRGGHDDRRRGVRPAAQPSAPPP